MIMNIVSGKGGTGKTLFCVTLAEMLGTHGNRTLVIDMDFAVRGLTALLYYYQGEAYQIVEADRFCSYDFFEGAEDPISGYKYFSRIGLAKYKSFDVLPAVQRINQIIKLHSSSVLYQLDTKAFFKHLQVELGYKYVILDCRAGYDGLNSLLHEHSDITICVQEEDEISNITTSNLIRQFEKENEKPIFSMINKARSDEDVYNHFNEKNLRHDVTFLGSIPFDLDVMSSFGKPEFWDLLHRTLYYYSIAKIWNRISVKLKLNDDFEVSRVSPFGSNKFEKRLGFLHFQDRIIFIFSITIGFIGVLVGVFGVSGLKSILTYSSEQVIGLALGLGGFVSAFYVFFRSRKK